MQIPAHGAANAPRRGRRARGAAIAIAFLALALAAPAHAESPPIVTTGAASEASLTGASLTGTISSASPLAGCWFEWGSAPPFEASSPCGAVQSEGVFSVASGRAWGLLPGTTYQWRLAARNAAGVAHGSIGSFTTTGDPQEETTTESTAPGALEGLSGALPQEPALIAHARSEDGLFVAYCRRPGEPDSELSPLPRASSAMANHTGWPSLQCLKMDKGTYGKLHTLVGLAHVHNYLLGGYGNDTIWAGEAGDVIWGDYHPSGQRASQFDALHGGPGTDWIYSSHGYNQIWTGAGDDHLALVYGWGTIHCNGPGLKTLVMRLLPRNRHWRMVGCDHRVLVPYRA